MCNIFLLILIAPSVQDKDCRKTFRDSSGWISAPDNDGDGFYDFNLNCVWTVEVEPNKLIQFQLMYVDLGVYYMAEIECLSDKIMVSTNSFV